MLDFTGRSKELGRLRAALDEASPRVVRVTGMRGVGKSELIRRVLTDYPSLHVRMPPLPDSSLRRHLSRQAWNDAENAGDRDDSAPGSWEALFDTVLTGIPHSERPFVVCLDDAGRLTEARSRYLAPLTAAQRRLREMGTIVHVVLVGSRADLPDDDRLTAETGELSHPVIDVGPLPLRAAAPHLPGNTPADKIRAYGVFGGIPAVLAQLDPTVTVGTNVRRLALNPDGPLASGGLDWLERDVQSPARYAAIVAALSRGETDWNQVHAGVPDLSKSGQVAPYLKRLAELGLVRARQSLDAPPRSRGTRYSLTDPFIAFWFRFILPWRYGSGVDAAGRHYAQEIRPRIDDHLTTVFPAMCRQHLRHDALASLGAAPREEGSLWGQGVEIEAAGILTSGAAYYGVCRWKGRARDDEPLAELEANIRETRYGFGRARRIRLVFTGRPAPRRLHRDIARHADAQLIDASALAGEE